MELLKSKASKPACQDDDVLASYSFEFLNPFPSTTLKTFSIYFLQDPGDRGSEDRDFKRKRDSGKEKEKSPVLDRLEKKEKLKKEKEKEKARKEKEEKEAASKKDRKRVRIFIS